MPFKIFYWSLYKYYLIIINNISAGLEEIRNQLAKENLERNNERERKQLAELQAKRENSSIAFQTDIAKYLISGNVPSSKYAIFMIAFLYVI